MKETSRTITEGVGDIAINALMCIPAFAVAIMLLSVVCGLPAKVSLPIAGYYYLSEVLDSIADDKTKKRITALESELDKLKNSKE